MANFKIYWLKDNYALQAYCFSALFMVFFSIYAIQNWPNLWAQGAITLACILPTLPVLIKKTPSLIQSKMWPVEIKLVLIIIILGILNICFSENRWASFKGMGLFLMSGIMIFGVTFFLLNSKQAQSWFFGLCSICFIVLAVYGVFEFVQNINVPGSQIFLLSSNPIPAGSLIILLSNGPLALLAQARSGWERKFWLICLLVGALVIILTGKRGPMVALVVMVFVLAAMGRKRLWIVPLVALVLLGMGFQFLDKISPQYKERLLKRETVLIRLEFYRVAQEVVKDKPLFGLGFNAPMSRYIPEDYKSKWYPNDSSMPSSFIGIVTGVQTFDNMVLCFLGETGGLFTAAYLVLIAYLLKNFYLTMRMNPAIRMQGMLLLVVLAGFLTHSMSFDSLKYPDLNWLFHSLLGLVARYNTSRQKIL